MKLNVCPAPAGIGLPLCERRPSPRGLPRARGDRPPTTERIRRHLESAPRPRGSAHGSSSSVIGGLVCPAPAGIGPPTNAGGSHERGLPRARGDRPSARRTSASSSRSAPRPRGSALAKRWIGQGLSVCPAPAGIGRGCFRSARGRTRLPRARGDRPLRSRSKSRSRPSAPRPRGSALADAFSSSSPLVCPAPAGIGPIGKVYRVRGVRSAPRPRGSAGIRRSTAPDALVCPAPAGIGPFSRPCFPSRARLPRARGDRPESPHRPAPHSRSAPRPRGSALVERATETFLRVCPAPAGIGRLVDRLRLSLWRLPRARGDRPEEPRDW